MSSSARNVDVPPTIEFNCWYCGKPAVFHKTSHFIYRADYGAVWACSDYPRCDAYVGTHPDGLPKGILANPPLRKLKREVHALFDPLWMDAHVAYPDLKQISGHIRAIMRGRAYAWLAKQLRIAKDECHIGKFDDARCIQAIAVLKREAMNAVAIRAWAKEQQEKQVRK